MDKLDVALQRLHFLPADRATTGRRTICLAFLRATDWDFVANVWAAVQEALALPPPALSIDGQGYRLWFSFAEPLAADTAGRFLNGLHTAYLAEIPASCLQFNPDDKQLPPCALPGDERWAAFIDPGLGSMFVTEPWLDMPPNRQQQADLLAACRPIQPADLSRVLDRWPSAVARDATPTPEASPCETSSLQRTFADPRSFLLAVMNDPQTSMALRIEAATALLPYFGK